MSENLYLSVSDTALARVIAISDNPTVTVWLDYLRETYGHLPPCEGYAEEIGENRLIAESIRAVRAAGDQSVIGYDWDLEHHEELAAQAEACSLIGHALCVGREQDRIDNWLVLIRVAEPDLFAKQLEIAQEEYDFRRAEAWNE